MDLEHDTFLNGVVEASQGFLFHVVDCIGVCNGEVGVGNGDGVIQSKINYNELVDKDFGVDEEELLQVEEHARNEKLFVELEHNQKFWFTWNRTSTWAFFEVHDHITIANCSKFQ
jgi:hypothetical protein